jgi:hypothetical protein
MSCQRLLPHPTVGNFVNKSAASWVIHSEFSEFIREISEKNEQAKCVAGFTSLSTCDRPPGAARQLVQSGVRVSPASYERLPSFFLAHLGLGRLRLGPLGAHSGLGRSRRRPLGLTRNSFFSAAECTCLEQDASRHQAGIIIFQLIINTDKISPLIETELT